MNKYKEVQSIEYMADYSKKESERCGYDINWYMCHYCHASFIYDYGKSQRHDPNFCPVCGFPNRPIAIQVEERNNYEHCM